MQTHVRLVGQPGTRSMSSSWGWLCNIQETRALSVGFPDRDFFYQVKGSGVTPNFLMMNERGRGDEIAVQWIGT